MSSLGDAVKFVNKHYPLPRCVHGRAFCDGAGEILEPPCGCRLEYADEKTQKLRAIIFLGLRKGPDADETLED